MVPKLPECNLFLSTAPLPSPTDLVITPTSSSITLTWNQPSGADAVKQYEISYNFTINECGSDNEQFNLLINGLLRSFIITNSSYHPVEEDSVYNISITAQNSVVNSTATKNQYVVQTGKAGVLTLQPIC